MATLPVEDPGLPARHRTRRISATPRPQDTRRWGSTIFKLSFCSQFEGTANFLTLALGATGVVFGDIGTSPLYAFVGIWVGVLKSEPEEEDVVGTFSMLFWTLTWVVCCKYVGMVMRVSHHGEGGIFALMQTVLSDGSYSSAPQSDPKRALSTVASSAGPLDDSEDESMLDRDAEDEEEDSRKSKAARLRQQVTVIAMIGCSLIIGDGAITPVISVLSALQGASSWLSEGWQVLLAVGILFLLFGMQRYGSHVLGMFSGPIMVCWFLAIGGLGAYNLVQHPKAACSIARGFNPIEVYKFWAVGRFRGTQAWRSLAGVVLSVTGTEALYADMGHFGAGPISFAWFALVYPCLILQYMGQSAALVENPAGVADPFFSAVPPNLKGFMTCVATLAAILASQALISGVFSLLSQAHALELLPRILVLRTNPNEKGQVYIPEINWMLCAMCVTLCWCFRTSEALAGAYGVTVTGDAVITTVMLSMVLHRVWGWRLLYVVLVITPMLTIDILFWSANVLKIFDSGWVPLLITSIACLLMHSHHWGRRREKLCLSRERAAQMRQLCSQDAEATDPLLAPISTVPALQALLRAKQIQRIGSMGIFLTQQGWRVPRSLDTLVKSLHCLPSTIVLLSLHFESIPFVLESERVTFEAVDSAVGLYRVALRFGYAEPLTAERFAIHKTLIRIASKQVQRHPGLQPLLETAETITPTPRASTRTTSRLSSSLNAHGVTYILGRENYAIEPWHTCWTRLRAQIYSFLSLNARKPITTFGLEEQNTMEIAVVRFL